MLSEIPVVLDFLGAVLRQNIMVRAHGGTKLLTSWQPRSKEKERREEGARIPISPQGMTPVT
jgi:hypothetical protein